MVILQSQVIALESGDKNDQRNYINVRINSEL
jgi:hypothetical protein